MKQKLLLVSLLTTFTMFSQQTGIDLSANGNRITGTYALPVITTGFTVEYWFKLNGVVSTQSGLFSQGVTNQPGPIDVYVDHNNGSRLVVYTGNGLGMNNYYLSSFVPTVGTWYHIAHTVTPSGFTNLFVNGSYWMSGSGPVGTPTTSTFYFGNRADNGTEANVTIDELRIWSSIRTQTEISSNMNNCLTGSETGLQVYYKMNEASGTTLTDSATGNGPQNGTISGAFSRPSNTFCATLSTVGFENNSNFKLYPNPVNSDVNIELNNLNNAKLEVFDINGRLLKAQELNLTENKINTNELPIGLYLFKVSSNEGTATTKVVKQ